MPDTRAETDGLFTRSVAFVRTLRLQHEEGRDLTLGPQACAEVAGWLERLQILAEITENGTTVAPSTTGHTPTMWSTEIPDDDMMVDPDVTATILIRAAFRWASDQGVTRGELRTIVNEAMARLPAEAPDA